LESPFERARANQGNPLKQRRDFVRRYDEYQALDNETKAQVDQEMIVEENKVLEQERVAILADWRQYYPNQFPDDGLPLVNPPTSIEVVTGLFLSKENTMEPAIDLLALVLREASGDRR